MKSIYIHIPFCKNICTYCDFCKMFYNEKLVDDYLDSLDKEIKKYYSNEKIKTIYIGGGTPSTLNIKQLKKLFSILSIFKLDKDYEYTFEANFDSITKEKLLLLKENKVNRLSFGIETFNKKFLKDIGRSTSYKKTKQVIEECIRVGISNINIDLMYGFKDQSIKDLKEDLDLITSFDITHISTYSLIIEEHTKLYIDKYERLNDDLDSSMYYFIIKYLKDKGFNQYEISNFSKEGYNSIHNLTYWNNLEYLGFGLSSSGYVNNIRYTNTKSITSYLKGNYNRVVEKVSDEVRQEYEMILGLRKTKGVCESDFYNKYHLTIEERFDIIELVKNKLLVKENGYIFIPQDKLYISNSILIYFIGGK